MLKSDVKHTSLNEKVKLSTAEKVCTLDFETV